MTINDSLRNSAQRYPDKIAVVHQEGKLSYAQLDRLSTNFALSLVQRGVERGERVALFLDNGFEYLISYFGILKSGAVVVALNTQLVERELLYPLNDCTPKVIVTDLKYSQKVKEILKKSTHSPELVTVDKTSLSQDSGDPSPLASVHPTDDDLAAIIYTSGTTGKPKGVMLSHGNFSANADSIVEYLHLTSDDRIMVILPFYYSYGTSLLTTHIRVGGTLIIDNRFAYPNLVLDTMVKEGATGFAGVPSHFAILMKKSAIRKYRFPHLRYVTQAGGAMPPAMIKEFLTILPQVEFYVMYGQTEAAARLSYLEPSLLFEKMGSVGKGIPGVELDVLNDRGAKVKPGEMGEIVARGKNIMRGYWNAPAETASVLRKEGLFTGDLARVDEDGFIYIVSRKKDMIKSGANRISPLEIEDVVCQIPGVVECAAVGVPDEILGEAIKLFVVMANDEVSRKDIMIFCKERLAFYKLPKEIEMVAKLPKTASGKIRRESLKETVNS